MLTQLGQELKRQLVSNYRITKGVIEIYRPSLVRVRGMLYDPKLLFRFVKGHYENRNEVEIMKYRVGVIGRTGGGGYGHSLDSAWLDLPNTEVVAVADGDQTGLAAAAERLGVANTFLDYRKMLDQVQLDIVAVCERWIDRHCEITLAAMERGIHVFMEKPFCRTLEEADKIVDASERTGAKVAIGHPTHYSPKLQTLKNLIDEGRIGHVIEYRGRGKEDHRGGAEDLWVLGTHIMDMIRFLGGHPRWCFGEVTQDGRPITKADVVEGSEGLGPLAGDAVSAVYGMADESCAYFASRRNASSEQNHYALTVYGTEGMFEICEGVLPSLKYLHDPTWSPGRTGSRWQDVSSAGIGQSEPLSGHQYEARYFLAIRDFLNAIENDRQPLDNAVEARGGLEMTLAVFESCRLDRKVDLPLASRLHPLSLL